MKTPLPRWPGKDIESNFVPVMSGPWVFSSLISGLVR